MHTLIRRTAVIVGLLVLIGTAHPSWAQAVTRSTACSPTTANNELCITWAAPTANADGTPVVLPLTYRVEQKLGAGVFTSVATALGSGQYYAKNLAPGTYTFRVFANCSAVECVESVASNTTSKDAKPTVIQPNAPVIIIAATINADGPPTYRVIQSVTLKPNEVVFAAPAALRPLFAAR